MQSLRCRVFAEMKECRFSCRVYVSQQCYSNLLSLLSRQGSGTQTSTRWRCSYCSDQQNGSECVIGILIFFLFCSPPHLCHIYFPNFCEIYDAKMLKNSVIYVFFLRFVFLPLYCLAEAVSCKAIQVKTTFCKKSLLPSINIFNSNRPHDPFAQYLFSYFSS